MQPEGLAPRLLGTTNQMRATPPRRRDDDPEDRAEPSRTQSGSIVMWGHSGETFALLELPADSSPRRYFAEQLGLSLAELEVVTLAVRGLRNAEIGAMRKASPRTVRNQLASAYAKLGVGSRSELAARYPWLGDDE